VAWRRAAAVRRLRAAFLRRAARRTACTSSH
jgi:hypothetical protein